MKICGHEYKVFIEFVDNMKREDDPMFFGQVRVSTGVIRLWPRAKRDVQEESLIHEIIHAILTHSNSRSAHDEQVVGAIAGGLYQLGVGKFLWKKAKPKISSKS